MAPVSVKLQAKKTGLKNLGF